MDNVVKYIDEEMSLNEEMPLKKDIKLCTLLTNFCNSLITFAGSISLPTVVTTIRIKNKHLQTKSFDNYVTNVGEFNIIVHKIIDALREIITSLNTFFIGYKLDDLTNFIESLRKFLLFLLNENIFDNLNDVKQKLDKKYLKNYRIIKNVTYIKHSVFDLFDQGIGITTVFIPQLIIIKDIVLAMEEHNINFDAAIKKLIAVQLRSQIKLGDNILQLLSSGSNIEPSDKSKAITHIIENLKIEYTELIERTLNLDKQVIIYKHKKRSIFSILFYFYR